MAALISYHHTCNGCGVRAGKRHQYGCDVARCAEHGIQQVQCEPDCQTNRWTGYWAGELEAVEFGWFTHFVPNGKPSWQPCGPEHPKAVTDLNRIMTECDWDPQTQRFVRRS